MPPRHRRRYPLEHAAPTLLPTHPSGELPRTNDAREWPCREVRYPPKRRRECARPLSHQFRNERSAPQATTAAAAPPRAPVARQTVHRGALVRALWRAYAQLGSSPRTRRHPACPKNLRRFHRAAAARRRERGGASRPEYIYIPQAAALAPSHLDRRPGHEFRASGKAITVSSFVDLNQRA